MRPLCFGDELFDIPGGDETGNHNLTGLQNVFLFSSKEDVVFGKGSSTWLANACANAEVCSILNGAGYKW